MARKQKYINELEKQGFSLVPETVGKITDSIWHHDEKQILIIKFATGQTLTFKPIENDLVLLENGSAHQLNPPARIIDKGNTRRNDF